MEEKTHILVVDDEPDIRNILRILLQAKGYDVCEAQNGLAAIEQVQAHPCADGRPHFVFDGTHAGARPL